MWKNLGTQLLFSGDSDTVPESFFALPRLSRSKTCGYHLATIDNSLSYHCDIVPPLIDLQIYSTAVLLTAYYSSVAAQNV